MTRRNANGGRWCKWDDGGVGKRACVGWASVDLLTFIILQSGVSWGHIAHYLILDKHLS
jgi:hypothetical protein